MRIIVFSELFYPHGGGAELATWLYSKLLVEKGFEVTIVTRQFPGEASIEFLSNSMKILRVPIRIAFGSRYDTLANSWVLASTFIRRLINESDIVYVPCGWYSVIPLAKIYGKPVVVHMHNYSIVCPTSLMYDFVNHKVGVSSLKSFLLHEIIERRRGALLTAVSALMNELLGKHYNRLGRLVDAIIFVSRAQMDLALSTNPSLKRKSYVIYNPIPNLPLIKSEMKSIGYFGGRSFVKGFYTLMEALKSLRPSNVEAYMALTWRSYKTLKLNNGILINLMPKINPYSIMKKLSIVAIPSLIPEPSPYVLVESMLYGKLIIASNIGGIPEIVSGCSGVKLVEPENYVAIASALNYFLSFDLEEINDIGVKNREYTLRKINNEEILKHFIKILYKKTS